MMSFQNVESSEEGHKTAQVISLQKYENVAIETDLEPDDVLALRIIFSEANLIYQQQTEKKYPIKLIIVGEGCSLIKRLRMEKMLTNFFDIPPGVQIKVVEGKSTSDNIFPFDGEEFFNREFLSIHTEMSDGSQGIQALEKFINQSENPLVIQLKPAQELFEISFQSDLSQKTTVFLYGGFNLRRTIQDETVLVNKLFDSVRNEPFVKQYQLLIDHFSTSFKKLGILETFGLLGNQSAVFHKHLWTNGIADIIENSNDDFFQMFHMLSSNWNAYLCKKEVYEVQHQLESLLTTFLPTSNPNLICGLNASIKNLDSLTKDFRDDVFQSTYTTVMDLIKEIQTIYPKMKSQLGKIEDGLNFIDKVKPSSGLQFTLADVGVALAICDHTGFFTASPVQVLVNQQGHLETLKDPKSNVIYYDRVNREDFATILEVCLQSFASYAVVEK